VVDPAKTTKFMQNQCFFPEFLYLPVGKSAVYSSYKDYSLPRCEITFMAVQEKFERV